MGSVLTTRLEVKDSAFKAKMQRNAKTVRSYGKETDKATKLTGKFGRKMSAIGKTVGSTFTNKLKGAVGSLGALGSGLLALGPGGIAVGAAVAGLAVISKVMDSLAAKGLAAATSVDALTKTAGKLGFASNEFAALKLGSTISGVTDAAFDVGLRFFIRRVGELRLGLQEAKSAFAKVEDITGIKQSVFLQKSTSDQLNVVAQSIAATADASEKLALAKLFGGDSGADLVPFFEALAKSSDGFRSQLKGINAEISTFDQLMASAIKDQETFSKFTVAAQGVKGAKGRLALQTEIFRSSLADNLFFNDPTSQLSKAFNSQKFADARFIAKGTSKLLEQQAFVDDLKSRQSIEDKAERDRVGAIGRKQRDKLSGLFSGIGTQFSNFGAKFKMPAAQIGNIANSIANTFQSVARVVAKAGAARAKAKAIAKALFSQTRTPLEQLIAQREDLREKFFAPGSQVSENVFKRKLNSLEISALELERNKIAGKKISPVKEVLNKVLGGSQKGMLETLRDSIRQIQGARNKDVNSKILTEAEEQTAALRSIDEAIEKIQQNGVQLSVAVF